MVSRSTQPRTTASTIIDRLIKAAGVKNATALAGLLKVTPQAVSSAKKKGKIPQSWIQLVAKRFNVPVESLQYGSSGVHSPNRETENGEPSHHEMKRFWHGRSYDEKAVRNAPLPPHVTEEIFFLSRRLVEAQDELLSLTEIKHKLEMTIQKLRFEKERLDRENQQLKEQIKLLIAEGNSDGYRNAAHGER